MYIVCGQQTMSTNLPSLQIDLESPVPAYRQIANALRILLVSGALPEGARFATTRQLAMDLGVHRNTVAEAYRILADEGWLELRRGNGVTVMARTGPRADEETRQRWARRLDELVAEGLADGLQSSSIAELLRAARDRLGVDEGGATGSQTSRCDDGRRE